YVFNVTVIYLRNVQESVFTWNNLDKSTIVFDRFYGTVISSSFFKLAGNTLNPLFSFFSFGECISSNSNFPFITLLIFFDPDFGIGFFLKRLNYFTAGSNNRTDLIGINLHIDKLR